MCICSQGMSSQGIKAYTNISIICTSTIVDSCEAYAVALCGGEQMLSGRLVHEGRGDCYCCLVAAIMRVREAKAMSASFCIGVACKLM